jgi:phosphoribosylamine---glycine ligase
MKILIIGGGAREHALAWKFSKSKSLSGLYAMPGNAGMEALAASVGDVDPMNNEAVAGFCRTHKIDLVFVGPEDFLANGIVDHLSAQGIQAIGPGRKAAALESSKTFAKAFMQKHRIPTADYREFTDFEVFRKQFKSSKTKVVLKKSGLAAGKGVLETDNREAALAFALQVLKDDSLVVEEFLGGWEMSLFVLCDGKNYRILPPCTDHKKALDNDLGMNTGGMGAICPVPLSEPALMTKIRDSIVAPTFAGLAKEGDRKSVV